MQLFLKLARRLRRAQRVRADDGGGKMVVGTESGATVLEEEAEREDFSELPTSSLGMTPPHRNGFLSLSVRRRCSILTFSFQFFLQGFTQRNTSRFVFSVLEVSVQNTSRPQVAGAPLKSLFGELSELPACLRKLVCVRFRPKIEFFVKPLHPLFNILTVPIVGVWKDTSTHHVGRRVGSYP